MAEVVKPRPMGSASELQAIALRLQRDGGDPQLGFWGSARSEEVLGPLGQEGTRGVNTRQVRLGLVSDHPRHQGYPLYQSDRHASKSYHRNGDFPKSP